MSLLRPLDGELHAGFFIRTALRKGRQVQEVIRKKEQPRAFRKRVVPATERSRSRGALTSAVLGTHGYSDKLYFCPVCAEHGLLPEVFQLAIFAVCPVHRSHVTHLCAHCQHPVKRSDLYHGEPFACRRCDHPIHGGVTGIEEEVIEGLLSELASRCDDFLKKLLPLGRTIYFAAHWRRSLLTFDEKRRLRDFGLQILLADGQRFPDYIDPNAICLVRPIVIEDHQSEFDSALWRKAATAVALKILAAVLSLPVSQARLLIGMDERTFCRLFDDASPHQRDELVAFWHWRGIVRRADQRKWLPWRSSIATYHEAALGYFLRLLEEDVLYDLERPGLAWSYSSAEALDAVDQTRSLRCVDSRSALYLFRTARCRGIDQAMSSHCLKLFDTWRAC